MYQARPGYANYQVNQQRRDELLAACPQRRQSAVGKPWRLFGVEPTGAEATILLGEEQARYESEQGEYWIKTGDSLHDQRDPPGTGGLLAALHLWRTLLSAGPDALQEVFYLGQLPWGERNELCECLVASQGGARAEFYFDKSDSRLMGIEYFADEASDSCHIAFGDFTAEDAIPRSMAVSNGDRPWTELSGVRVLIGEPAQGNQE